MKQNKAFQNFNEHFGLHIWRTDASKSDSGKQNTIAVPAGDRTRIRLEAEGFPWAEIS